MLVKHKRFLTIFLILCMLLNSNLVLADDPLTGGLPDINELFKSGDLSKYLTEYRDNYALDMVKFSVYKEPMGLTNSIASFFFVCQLGVAYLLITIFYFSFELDFFELFGDILKTLIGELEIAVYDELMIVAIVLLGAFYIVKILQNQKTQIWIAIIQTVAIIAIASAFFSNPSAAFQGVDKFSKEISRNILTGTYRANNKGTPESAVTAAANEIWTMFVHRPWQILEFGNEKTALKYQDQILSLSPDSEKRKELVEKLSEERDIFTTSWGLKRLGFMVLYFIPLAVQFVGMILLCLLMLGYQALLIILAVIGVFVFLVSLIPFFGIRVVGNWGAKILSCSATKIAITFMLALLIAFNSAIFKLADKYGWLLVLIIQLIIILIAIYKRQMLLDIFSIIRLTPQGSLQKNRLNRDYNLERKMVDYSKGKELRKSRNKEIGAVYEYYKDEENTGDRKILVTSIPGVSNSHEAETVSSQRYSDTSIRKDEASIVQNQSYSNLMKLAEEVLEKQYDISKEMAEKKAEETGSEVKYPYFVNKVDTREALGAPRFDDREIVLTMEKVKDILKYGGNIEQLYEVKEGTEESKINEVERPQSVVQIYMDGQKYEIEDKELKNLSIDEVSIQLTEEFNQTYDRKFDKEFMHSLIKKYGETQVRMVLNRMKEIEKKNGSIKNPAGYLTQSLKNNKRDNVNVARENMRGKEEQ